MKLLEELAQLCRKIKDGLAAEIEVIERQTPTTLATPKCQSTTKVGQLIKNLSDTTKAADVESLAIITETERFHYETLKRDLASDPAATARALDGRKSRFKDSSRRFKEGT